MLRAARDDWARAAETCAAQGLHLESFGGCMLGQLCPPSLLVAISLLEGMFFRQCGVTSMSLSYAQQTNHAQDVEAVLALRSLAAEFLPDVRWHVVVYTFMGVFPETETGARRLIAESARLAVETGCERLIVKTVAEAHRIPTVAENVAALELADRAAAGFGLVESAVTGEVHAEASTLVNAVLELDSDVGAALVKAFALGYLDVPYCLHPDNRGATRAAISSDGWLRWARTGNMPVPLGARSAASSADLLAMLHYNQQRYDAVS